MKKKNKKLVWILSIILIIGGILYFTPLLEMIGFTEPGFCSETPHNSDCICLEGYEKLVYEQSYAGDWYFCENKEKFIDTKNQNWQEESKTYMKQKFLEQYPDCDMIECNQGDAFFEILEGFRIDTEDKLTRVVSIECRDEVQQKVFSEFDFNPSNGDVFDSRCASYNLKPTSNQVNPLARLSCGSKTSSSFYNGVMHYYVYNDIVACSISSDCELFGREESSTTISLPEGYKCMQWEYSDGSIFGEHGYECSLSEINQDSAKLTCGYTCGGGIGYTQDIKCLQGGHCKEDSYKCVFNTDIKTVIDGSYSKIRTYRLEQCINGDYSVIKPNLLSCNEDGEYEEIGNFCEIPSGNLYTRAYLLDGESACCGSSRCDNPLEGCSGYPGLYECNDGVLSKIA